MRHFRGFGHDHLSRGYTGQLLGECIDKKGFYDRVGSVPTSHDSLKVRRSLRNPQHRTLTLPRPTPNAITHQHSQYVTLTPLTPTNDLSFVGLLVRRVCEDGITPRTSCL